MPLLADVNCPGFQEDFVSNWESAHSLVEDDVSWAKIASRLPTLAVTHLPLYLLLEVERQVGDSHLPLYLQQEVWWSAAS